MENAMHVALRLLGGIPLLVVDTLPEYGREQGGKLRVIHLLCVALLRALTLSSN